MENFAVKKSHIHFLLLMMIISSNFFRLSIIPEIVVKALGFITSTVLVLWGVKKILCSKYMSKWAREIWFVLLFLIVVFFSSFSALFFWNQSILKSLFVIYPWGYIMAFFVFVKYDYNKIEVYEALKIFSILFFIIQFVAMLLPFNIVGALGGDVDVSRGVSRIRMGGIYYMHFWGLYNVVLYCQKRKKKYLYSFLLCLLFVVLSVSRQHIIIFAVLTFGYMLFNLNAVRLVVLMIIATISLTLIMPHTSIYKGLVEKEHDETVYVDGKQGDVRAMAMEYFLYEFPSNNITKIIGNCQYNMDSNYGKHIASLRRYFLSDIGFVGIYIYFGFLGILCLAKMLLFTLKKKTNPENIVFKLFIYYLFCTNVMSHSFDVAQVGVAISLYFLASNSPKFQKLKGLPNASCLYSRCQRK